MKDIETERVVKMNVKELKEDNRYLKNQNELLVNKLAGVLRLIDAYSLMGKTEVPIKDIREIMKSNEMI